MKSSDIIGRQVRPNKPGGFAASTPRLTDKLNPSPATARQIVEAANKVLNAKQRAPLVRTP